MSECEHVTKHFIDKLVDIYFNYSKNTDKSKVTVRRDIQQWFKNGTHSDTMEYLLLPEHNTNNINPKMPIWWSGFYIENATKSSPVVNMTKATNKLHGYISFKTKLGNAQNIQNKFWNICAANNTYFKWGVYLSETYTNVALKHNPKNITLFVDSDVKSFLNSIFFNVEVNIINNHYKQQNKKVIMRIYDLKDNCADIIKVLQKNHSAIQFKCYNNCNSLRKCVTRKRASIKRGGTRRYKRA